MLIIAEFSAVVVTVSPPRLGLHRFSHRNQRRKLAGVTGNQRLTCQTSYQLQDQGAPKSATGLVFFSALGKMEGIGKPFKDTWNLEVW
jgi:hypothetical protein